ncbi:psbP domain-containing protein 5 [Pyrus ussuriensis x Pyrus communis]|uniref:PsbP domain-containing protein 5 n=1 Tax=Pyrus ussuriensis x Pyrus communis TaxID=2448454 RepID=A0A5N5HRH2_9ROSA|nr:psbP domain-containing protein 5 [Pyrus ussuriensis x Pyrus communis]
MQQLNKWQISSSGNSKPSLQDGFCRRELLPVWHFCSMSLAEEDLKMASFVDDINSYSYLYPTELPSKKALFKWVESRKPERYSLAAPLSPDARLRIVSERVDIVDNLIISISIGPPNSKIIKSQDKSTWTAKDAVLADKSALRVTSTQRQAESQVLDAHTGEIDGQLYWYYEYLVRKAPTKTADESTNYRRYVASTTERDGGAYLTKNSSFISPSPSHRKLRSSIQGSVEILEGVETYLPGQGRWAIKKVHGLELVTSIARRRGATLWSPQKGEPMS